MTAVLIFGIFEGAVYGPPVLARMRGASDDGVCG
jgi:hypothetical protein